jgi:hypothetical protein
MFAARPVPTSADTIQPPPIRPGGQVYVPESGQVLGGPFLSYWLVHQDQLGLPVTGVVDVNGLPTQWFEYARLELDPVPIETATAANVHWHQIGRSFAEQAGYYGWLAAFDPQVQGEARFFSETAHTINNGFRALYERPGVPEQLGPPISEEFSIGDTIFQFFVYGAMTWTPASGPQIAPLGELEAGLLGYTTGPVAPPNGVPTYDPNALMNLSDVFAGERWIEVDLSSFEVIAWVGDVEVLRSVVSLGVPQSPTPTGDFRMYMKYRTQTLNGLTWDGVPYNEPDTPWVMYFYQDYAFHASNWRTEFGNRDSQGCVVPPMDVAQKLWEWSSIGTRVWVHE